MHGALLMHLLVIACANEVVREYLEAVAKFGFDKMILQPDESDGAGFASGSYSYGSGTILKDDNDDDVYDTFSSGILNTPIVDKEHFLAFQEFKREVDFINSHNEIPFSAEVNKFAILTKVEQKMYTGINTSLIYDDDDDFLPTDAFQGAVWGSGFPIPDDEIFSYPDSLDWEERGALNSIKFQGLCGSCWAFAAVAALESAYYIKTGDLVSFSEQEPIDCYYETRESLSNGCKGGPINGVFKYVRNKDRIASQKDTGYHSEDRVCDYDTVPNALKKVIVTGFNRFKGNKDEDGLIEGLQSGPVVTCVDTPKSFYMYRNGIFQDEFNCQDTADHAVTVVGYGSVGGRNFWKARNSWGTSWGEEGYIKMSRDVPNNCMITSYLSQPILECRIPGTCRGYEPIKRTDNVYDLPQATDESASHDKPDENNNTDNRKAENENFVPVNIPKMTDNSEKEEAVISDTEKTETFHEKPHISDREDNDVINDETQPKIVCDNIGSDRYCTRFRKLCRNNLMVRNRCKRTCGACF